MFDADVNRLIREEAKRLDISPSALFAVVEVESAGVSRWLVNGEYLPPIRFEGHYFHRRLHGTKLKAAIRQGLAHSRAGRVKNPRSYAARYAMLNRAIMIDRQAALESISMGVGQVMGAHWLKLGYQSIDHMWEDVCSSLAGQIRAMIRFIEANKLVRFLRALKWHKFARAYNGPAYKKNRYARKMANAYARHSKGMAPEAFKQAWLDKLSALDYQSVKAFQADYGLVVDGIVGPMTLEAIDEALEAKARQKKVKIHY